MIAYTAAGCKLIFYTVLGERGAPTNTLRGIRTPELVLCAGQGCGARRSCLRFRMRGLGLDYASFDIERLKFEAKDKDGRCPVFLAVAPSNFRKH